MPKVTVATRWSEELWGPFVVRIGRPYSYKAEILVFEGKNRMATMKRPWEIVIGKRRIDGSFSRVLRGVYGDTKKEALRAARCEMHKRMDLLPDRIEKMETEYESLREFFR